MYLSYQLFNVDMYLPIITITIRQSVIFVDEGQKYHQEYRNISLYIPDNRTGHQCQSVLLLLFFSVMWIRVFSSFLSLLYYLSVQMSRQIEKKRK